MGYTTSKSNTPTHTHHVYTQRPSFRSLHVFVLSFGLPWLTHTHTESESLFASTFFPNCTPDCHSYGLQALEYRAELSNNHNRFINLYLTCNQYNKLHKAYSLNDSIDFILQNCSTEIRICFKLCGFFFLSWSLSKYLSCILSFRKRYFPDSLFLLIFKFTEFGNRFHKTLLFVAQDGWKNVGFLYESKKRITWRSKQFFFK